MRASTRIRQADRFTNAPECFSKIGCVALLRDRQIVKEAAIRQERRVDADSFLAAERRSIDQRGRDRRALRDRTACCEPARRISGLPCATALSQAFVASTRSRDAACATPNSIPQLNTVCPLSGP